MSIQYTAPGFEPTTFDHEPPPRAPATILFEQDFFLMILKIMLSFHFSNLIIGLELPDCNIAQIIK